MKLSPQVLPKSPSWKWNRKTIKILTPCRKYCNKIVKKSLINAKNNFWDNFNKNLPKNQNAPFLQQLNPCWKLFKRLVSPFEYRNSIAKQEWSSPRDNIRRYSSFHNRKEALRSWRSISHNIQEQNVYLRWRPSLDGLQWPLFLWFGEGSKEFDTVSPMMIGHISYICHSKWHH
jgi:hypothetical protein